MNNFLLYILKSTICISLLYLGFRILMRKETFFKLNRILLLSVVVCSTIIPLLYLPQIVKPTIQNQLIPTFQNLEIMQPGQSVQEKPTQNVIELNAPHNTHKEEFPWRKLLRNVYLVGILITFLILIHGIVSILILFRKANFRQMEGFRLLIIDHEIPPFSFGRFVIISQSDFEAHQQTILAHEQAHIRLNHFYDLALLEMTKIFHWFNPVIYWLIRDMKEIHEFQADQYTLNKGIDATQYQILIIQKSVGSQRFALANSFNHCQIKKRITMMNKQKTSKARRWKVATFLPLLALLLMAFSKTGESSSDKSTSKKEDATSSIPIQSQQQKAERVIQIKSDGNYIDNKLCSLDQIEKTVKDWANASNNWIQIHAEKTTSNHQIDELLEKLGGNAAQYHITILLDDSETIYPAGDVSSMAKFRENWNKWLRDQLSQYSEGKSDQLDFSIKYRFIIDKAGKVTGARIVKKSQSTEINTAMEKVLSQIPDWTPAKRGNQEVSVLYDEIWMKKAKNSNIKMLIPPPPPPPQKTKTTSKQLLPPPPSIK